MSTIDINGADDPPNGTDASHALDNIEIRTLHTADEMVELGEVFQQVWGSVTQLVTIEILMAVTHSGGYVSAAYETARRRRAHARRIGRHPRPTPGATRAPQPHHGPAARVHGSPGSVER